MYVFKYDYDHTPVDIAMVSEPARSACMVSLNLLKVLSCLFVKQDGTGPRFFEIQKQNCSPRSQMRHSSIQPDSQHFSSNLVIRRPLSGHHAIHAEVSSLHAPPLCTLSWAIEEVQGGL
mmetsp:Transcript_67396/g.113091  ORF Transcript_67396/g.113091 Transcript_67396/m.113091 type:complete len:119 (+) Transcript_67396:191-547(+)